MDGGKAVRRKVVRKPKKSAKRSPKKSAKRSPKKSAKRSPKRSPKKSPKRSPKKSAKRSPKKSAKRSPRRSPQNRAQRMPQRMPQRTVPRRVERIAGHCDTLFRQINHLGPNAPIRSTDVENTYAFIDNFHPETKWKGPIQIQGHTFYIDTNKNPINCGSFGCGYLSSRNDFNKTLVVKVLKICPNVPQMNQEEQPVNFAKEIQDQMKAANLGVAPKIQAQDLNQGSLAMEYLDPNDYKSLRDLRFSEMSAQPCSYIQDQQELALFEAFYKLQKNNIHQADLNPSNWMIPMRRGLPAKIIDQGLIRDDFNPMSVFYQTLALPRIQKYILKHPGNFLGIFDAPTLNYIQGELKKQIVMTCSDSILTPNFENAMESILSS